MKNVKMLSLLLGLGTIFFSCDKSDEKVTLTATTVMADEDFAKFDGATEDPEYALFTYGSVIPFENPEESYFDPTLGSDCETCSGSGKLATESICGKCEGEGIDWNEETCAFCGGTGKTDKCSSCDGTGKNGEYVSIPFSGDEKPEYKESEAYKGYLAAGYLLVDLQRAETGVWNFVIGSKEETVNAFMEAARTMSAAQFREAYPVYEDFWIEMFPDALYLWDRFEIIRGIMVKKGEI